MWWGGNGSWAEHLLAVSRRIFVRLEEGDGKTADKTRGKARIAGHLKKALQEREGGNLHGREHAHPLFLLPSEQIEPVIKQLRGNKETFTEFFHGSKMQEILCKDPEDEKEAIGGVRDDEVREDGMGMAAGTDKAQDAETVADRVSLNKINKRTAIVGMDSTGAFRPTAGTGLGFRTETSHEGIKKVFR